MTRHNLDRDHPQSSGWSWLCVCGWSSHRQRTPDIVDGQRQAHIRWHDHQTTAPIAGAR